MFNPVSTYRIQFNKEFNFEKFQALIPYYKRLGINTIYASPIFSAVPGSTHGYDVTDPLSINPEIGTIEQLRQISRTLRDEGIGWVQDIVPNHMAFHPNNKWLTDVLEKGSLSQYATFYDMAGTSELFAGRVMVPFLGDSLEAGIKNGELKTVYYNGGLSLSYYDTVYPLKLSSYSRVLSLSAENNQAIAQLSQQLGDILSISEPTAFAKATDEVKLQLASLYKNEGIKTFIDNNLDVINNDKQRLQQLVDEQHYRLCSWQETDTQINFRRFFTVNGLICLNMHIPEVFNHYHRLIHELVSEGVFQGLRVDHIDGLYDPVAYLQNLRNLVGKNVYIVAEKILEAGEKLPADWPIQGTSGYDYLALVNNLYTSKNNEKHFDGLYQKLAGVQPPVGRQITDKKAYILKQHMGGELSNLVEYLYKLNVVNAAKLDAIGKDTIAQAIAEFLIGCPVYRYYGNAFLLDGTEATEINKILERITPSKPELSEATEVLQTIFTGNEDGNYNERLKFYQRCMQFTGPLMAKGVEDTLMYTYNRFTGHNEVGDSPEAFGITRKQFHEYMKARQQEWPLAMSGTATHDTKRGEDVRARLNVLTNLADEWAALVNRWSKQNKVHKLNGAPDSNDEYLIYQTIAGSYPMPDADAGDYEQRLHQYLEKALREAKVHTQWAAPNDQYETAAKQFASGLLDKESDFWQTFEPFYKKMADLGIINSLAQLVLKFTTPGIPDVYQGCERWDLSLVDPDNRRPVDYTRNNEILNELEKNADPVKALWADRYNGTIKLWLAKKLFELRKQHAGLFEKGDYIPLKVKGKHKEHVMAFARAYRNTYVVTIVPLHVAALMSDNLHPDEIDWHNTRVILPDYMQGEYTNLLTAKKLSGNEIMLKNGLGAFPVGIVKGERPANKRGSGILMHITSLPAAFGIGDIGPQAKKFVDFLASGHQKYWQILPLSPTEPAAGNSPYSSFSSVAGNKLLISPQVLLAEGLLSEKDVADATLSITNVVDYEKAAEVRKPLFEKAWQNFKASLVEKSDSSFKHYCNDEGAWLDDFALYTVLKYHHGGKPWYQWQQHYKLRDKAALNSFAEKHADEILKEKWLQYTFKQQWLQLKLYSNSKQVSIIGDMPFYISYDSADVWANEGLFDLDNEGNMRAVAGVPPDYFNADGQLWGMPVFRWDKLKQTGYAWWIQRIKKNLELYDLLRLDHFRAFSAYWQVPADEDTAVNGSWQPGPGKDFFSAVKKKLNELPFIAEDLGDIDEDVYQLRDEFELPGMRVLQFAFGDDIAKSPYIPHNYTENTVAYTGTHDNNTTVGWYADVIDKKTSKRIKKYSGQKVTPKNIHEILHRMLLASVANTVIVPLQDVLGLDDKARVNIPASTENNWVWRLTDISEAEYFTRRLRDMTLLYNRF
ncbi:4-alpha-glucanotransferase [Mucilaginibacter hurinus]|uniref:4-alpha-glucanotransferase n=1 Tax=Mucilaginibacter hurinus TaxID=2201324 RepID=A0A367GPK9_9SPHI|nr:malto-oligosyltrehalose synthase [Mucilaginibacter hurinus]RCH55399.1 4-alpha-glucanotransferase [Mucilaginibacter hurinus]